ncbi:MAG: zf-TFIIB domain-containing protein [Myxococcota bacterium]
MQLIACPVCHTQYDVSQIAADTIACRCGEELANEPLRSVDAAIARCGACGAQVSEEAKSCSYCGSDIVRNPEKLSLICPECFARNADDSRFCVGCGVAFRPEAVRAEGHELPCPACEMRMPPSQIAGISVNECEGCHGLWVGGGNFDALVRKAAELRRAAGNVAPPPRVRGGNPLDQKVTYRRCPECDMHMHRVNYKRSSGVILDECRNDGTFLDADELEQVAGFILSGGQTSPLLDTKTDEHEAAKRAAAQAAARIRVQTDTSGYARADTSGGILRILFDLLT